MKRVKVKGSNTSAEHYERTEQRVRMIIFQPRVQSINRSEFDMTHKKSAFHIVRYMMTHEQRISQDKISSTLETHHIYDKWK